MARSWASISALLCSGWWTASCGSPSLAYYRASPRQFCPRTDSIKLEWFTDATRVTLVGAPAVANLGERKGRGSLSIKPQATTVELDFGDKASRPKIQLTAIGPRSTSLTGSPAIVCSGGFSVGEAVFDDGEYAPEVVVRSLKNRLDDREIVVMHLGRSFTVAPGAELPIRAAGPDDQTVRMAHAWVIRVPHLPNETCSSKRVRNPGVIMNLECAP